jgi:hypothetical protein
MLVVFAACCASGAAQESSPATQPNSKIDGFIKHSGYQYKDFGKGIWGMKGPAGTILVVTTADTLVMGMVVPTQGKVKVTAESMSDLLKLTHDLDYLKVGIDDDNDIFIRTEQRIRLLDQAAFDDLVKRVTTGYERTLAKLAPYAIK